MKKDWANKNYSKDSFDLFLNLITSNPAMFGTCLIFLTLVVFRNNLLVNSLVNNNNDQTFFHRFSNRLNEWDNQVMYNSRYTNFRALIQNTLYAQAEIMNMHNHPLNTFLARIMIHSAEFANNPVSMAFYGIFAILSHRIYFANRFNFLRTKVLQNQVIPGIERTIERLKNNTNSGYYNNRSSRFLQSFLNFYTTRYRAVNNPYFLPYYLLKKWYEFFKKP